MSARRRLPLSGGQTARRVPPGAPARTEQTHVSRAERLPPSRAERLPVSNEFSAGGLVIHIEDGVPYAAIIARRGRSGRVEWCLPKGHLEHGETAAQAALREVSEETGIRGRVLRHLATIDYWFTGRDRRVHKVVDHYLMEYVAGTLSVAGDPDHEAQEARWIALALAHHRLAYPNERRIVDLALRLLYPRSPADPGDGWGR